MGAWGVEIPVGRSWLYGRTQADLVSEFVSTAADCGAEDVGD